MTAQPPHGNAPQGPIPLVDSVLEALSIDELQAVLNFIDESERAGRLSCEEAARWRSRIADWHRFRRVYTTGSHLPPD